MDATLKSNQLVFAGPFLGEFGWELSHWMPHVRWLRQHYKNHHLIVASYPGRHPLYYGIANEFWELPQWFLDEKYDLDCYEALAHESVYGKLLAHFKQRYENEGSFSNIVVTRAPRGFNHIIRTMNQVVFQELDASPNAKQACDKLIDECGNKPCVILFARAVQRKMFLDIKRNCPVSLEDIPGGLPTRNWPRSHWEDLFDMLYDKYHDRITFVVGGTKGGNCLLNVPNQYKNIIDLTEIDISESLDITIAMLKKSLCSISSQSGPSHLSLQTKCPSFIYGHEAERHAVRDNPFKTDVAFFETQIGKYNDDPELLFNDISVYIDHLLRERNISIQPRKIVPTINKEIKLYEEPIPKVNIYKPKEINSIGIVGVFDVEGSTNIPLANAFNLKEVYQYNYRTELQNKGAGVRDQELIALSNLSDIMIFCKGNGINPRIYEACSKNCYTCWFMMDAVTHLQNQDFYDYANICDFSIVTTMAMKEALEKHGIKKPVYHIIQPIDPEEFHPIDTVKKYDVVFIGTRSEKRDIIIDEILNLGYSVKTYGNGYDEYVTGEEFNRACCEAKICLAINNTEGDIDSFSDRILRYMATKSLVLTEYSVGLENYFRNGEECIYLDHDYLRTSLKLILSDEFLNMRNKIAKKGYKKVLKNHTWNQFAEKVLEITEGMIKNGK